MDIFKHYATISAIAEDLKTVFSEDFYSVEEAVGGKYRELEIITDLTETVNSLREEWNNNSPRESSYLTCSQYVAAKLYSKVLV